MRAVRMQDFFETRLLSMDTDFRVLSATHLGKLPGIDIAQVRRMAYIYRTFSLLLIACVDCTGGVAQKRGCFDHWPALGMYGESDTFLESWMLLSTSWLYVTTRSSVMLSLSSRKV